MKWEDVRIVRRVEFHYDVEALADCPTCHGKGLRVIRTRSWKEPDKPYPPLTSHYVAYGYAEDPCPQCDGKGRIRRIVDTDVDPEDYP